MHKLNLYYFKQQAWKMCCSNTLSKDSREWLTKWSKDRVHFVQKDCKKGGYFFKRPLSWSRPVVYKHSAAAVPCMNNTSVSFDWNHDPHTQSAAGSELKNIKIFIITSSDTSLPLLRFLKFPSAFLCNMQ